MHAFFTDVGNQKMQCGSVPKVVHARLVPSKVTLRTRSTFGSKKNCKGASSADFCRETAEIVEVQAPFLTVSVAF